jgi:hypothetical protein
MDIPEDKIPCLAALYDKFAYALDPFSEERDNAERVFMEEIANWHDWLPTPKPTLQEFRKGVITRCIRYLKASDKKFPSV